MRTQFSDSDDDKERAVQVNLSDTPPLPAAMSASPVPASGPHVSEDSPHWDCSMGDLIIRTSDGVEFHVERERLAIASPVFTDMFFLPHPPGGTSLSSAEKPIMDVSESGAVWERILYMCHHPPEPAFEYTHMQSLLDAGRKYSISAVKERMGQMLRSPDYLDKKPVSVYALACAYSITDVARLAARRTLRLGPVFEYVPELAAISGRAYHYLLQYRQKCSVAARAVVSRSATQTVPAWIDEDEIKSLLVCGRHDCESKTQYYYKRETDHYVRSSWLEYFGSLERSLEFRPDGSMATSTEMLEPVVVSAAECVACARKIFGQAMAFSKTVEDRIEAEIDQVSCRSSCSSRRFLLSQHCRLSWRSRNDASSLTTKGNAVDPRCTIR